MKKGMIWNLAGAVDGDNLSSDSLLFKPLNCKELYSRVLIEHVYQFSSRFWNDQSLTHGIVHVVNSD